MVLRRMSHGRLTQTAAAIVSFTSLEGCGLRDAAIAAIAVDRRGADVTRRPRQLKCEYL